MARLAYIEMQTFGEGEPLVPREGRYDGLQLRERTYAPIETAQARFAISTLLYAQGYFKAIAHDLASGFEARFPEEANRVLNGDEAQSTFFDFDLDDLTPRSRSAASLLLARAEVCSTISSRMMSDIGALPLWQQGITLYGVSEPNLIHVTTVSPNSHS